MASSSPDSYKISLNIINAIKQHPVLYVPEIKGNNVKPQEFRQKVWKRISNELGLDISWVKFRWKNLRDTYCRILKTQDKTKGSKKKQWVFEKHLDFLDITYKENCNYVELTEDYINDINSEDIRSNLEQLEENEEDEDYSNFLEILESEEVIVESSPVQSNDNNRENKTLRTKVESQNRQAVKRPAVEESASDQDETTASDEPKRKKFNNLSMTNLVLSKKSTLPKKTKSNKRVLDMSDKKQLFDYNTSIDSFFQNIAQNVKKLPPKVQADIKMDVSKIVSEAEISYLKKNTLQRVQKYSNMPGMVKKIVLVPCHMIDRASNKI